MHHPGQVLLALLLLLLLGGLSLRAVRQVQRARGPQGKKPAPRGGIVSGWFATRRALRLKQADTEHGMRRDRFRSALRMREQAERERRAAARAERQAGGRGGGASASGGGGPAGGSPRGPGDGTAAPPPAAQPGWRATVTHVWVRWHPAGDAARPGEERDALAPSAPEGPAPPARGFRWSRPPAPEPPARGAEDAPPPGSRPAPGHPEPPARPAGPSASAPGRVATPTLEGVVVTASGEGLAVPGVEDTINGLGRVHAHAMAGNAEAKRRAAIGLQEIARRAALTAFTLSRSMAEPGMHYGPEVTEPLATAGVHFTAAASACAESDAGIASILAALRELAGRQVPHYDEVEIR